MNVQIKLFGLLADIVGKNKIQMQDINDTESLREKIIFYFPKLKEYSFTMAISNQIIKGNHKINSGDEIVLLPPFAGG